MYAVIYSTRWFEPPMCEIVTELEINLPEEATILAAFELPPRFQKAMRHDGKELCAMLVAMGWGEAERHYKRGWGEAVPGHCYTVIADSGDTVRRSLDRFFPKPA